MLSSGDCERIRDGLIAQPINTLSSLAYLVAGAALLVRRRDGVIGLAFAITVGANGVGGILYHGSGGTVSRWVHDVALYATVGFVLVMIVQRRKEWRRLLAPRLLATGALAIVVYATSRTGGPLCAPDSVLQGHAAWHVLTALILWWWGRSRGLLHRHSEREPREDRTVV